LKSKSPISAISPSVPVIELYVKVGDSIKVDDAIATLESDKATMDVPSTVDGVIKEVLVQLGSKVGEGSVLIKVETGGAAAAPAPAAQAAAPSGGPCGAGCCRRPSGRRWRG
jgi:pyruvate dehydrogenase E2 component (dihydrolipoamide acetyltransferase)